MSVEDRLTPYTVAVSTAIVSELRNFVGGEFVRGDSFFDDFNPADGTIIARVSEAGPAIVDAAINAARQALRGEWGNAGVRQRAALLYKIADGIEARFDEFVQAESADTGKPVALASRLDVPRAAANFRVFADLIKTAPLEAFETETSDGKHALNYAVRKPVGVVGIVTPWNLPLLLMTWKVAPALACGNAVVVKPSEETPASATLLAEVMRDAGVPNGVFNLVHGFGEGSTGEYLVSHPGINAVTFHRRIAHRCCHHESMRCRRKTCLVRTWRQESGYRICRLRARRNHSADERRRVPEYWSGVSLRGTSLCRAADFRLVRFCDEAESREPAHWLASR